MTAALAGRTALVTGAGRGIGAAIARRLDADGARVAIVARSAEQLADVAATLVNEPVVIVGDLGTEDGPATIATAALDAFAGRLDVLVNNAAIASRKAAPDYTVADITAMLHINVRGVLLLNGAVLPTMVAAGRGSIVNISSVSGIRGTPRRTAYAATKAALDGITRATAMEYGPAGIRSNAVAPGVVATEMWRRELAIDGVEESLGAVTPLRRLVEPEEIADVVAFLVSDAASSVTGQTISADAGIAATVNLYPTV